jgi:DNA-binding GntR family transcriptional regulator
MCYYGGVSGHGLPPIERVVVDAILAGRIQAGTRLGEQVLADLFRVSRTQVREALIRLEAHGLVHVVPRRGWFIVDPSPHEVGEAFHARLAVELGILHCAQAAPPALVPQLRAHIEREYAAIAANDVSARCALASGFHVAVAEGLGNPTLANILLYLTARTVPITGLYQPSDAATVSVDEHRDLVDAIAAADFARARALMSDHLGHLRAVVTVRTEPSSEPDLRTALLRAPPDTAEPNRN